MLWKICTLSLFGLQRSTTSPGITSRITLFKDGGYTYSPAQKVCNRRQHHSRQKMMAKSRRLLMPLGVWQLATDATGCLAASRRVALGVWRLAAMLATRCLQSFVAYNTVETTDLFNWSTCVHVRTSGYKALNAAKYSWMGNYKTSVARYFWFLLENNFLTYTFTLKSTSYHK